MVGQRASYAERATEEQRAACARELARTCVTSSHPSLLYLSCSRCFPLSSLLNCMPSSGAAKKALGKLELKKTEVFVMELDQRKDGDDIQDALLEITGGRSVPRVFIDGEFFGGGDDTEVSFGAGKVWSQKGWCRGEASLCLLSNTSPLTS